MRARLVDKAETKWDIRPEVAREWGPTFDKLLTMHNTQDVKTITTSLWPGSKSYEHEDNKLPINELKNWVKPKFTPSIWKKYLCKERYLKEQKMYKKRYVALFGEQSDNHAKQWNNPSTTEEGTVSFVGGICQRTSFEPESGITRAQFIDRIMEEIRDGDKEVLKTLKFLF